MTLTTAVCLLGFFVFATGVIQIAVAANQKRQDFLELAEGAILAWAGALICGIACLVSLLNLNAL